MKYIISKMLVLIVMIGYLLGTTSMSSIYHPLVMIDYQNTPIAITEPLIFSTLTGNRTQDYITCVDFDEYGNIYVGGIIQDTGNDDDNCDSYLMKINGTDFTIIYYYTIKGSDFDFVNDMTVHSGKVYLVGNTGSPDFPTENAFCDTFQNSTDCFLMCLDANSLDLVFSTYLGGEHVDTGESIFVDNEGSIFITGETNSYNFPQMNSYVNYSGSSIWPLSVTYVAKFNSSGNGLIYSSLVGGSGGDISFAITADSQGNAYVAGITTSDDFPTINAYNSTSNGVVPGIKDDGIVFCLNSTGNGLIFSTYIGGTASEVFYDIALDATNDVWVCGYTESDDFPVVGGLQGNMGDVDGILFQLSSNGSVLLSSTYLGGSDYDVCYSIDFDERDNLYIAGSTISDDFREVRKVSLLDQSNRHYGYQGFIMKISPENSILYSSLVGGQGVDDCRSIAVGNNGTILVGGYSSSDDFPLKREISASSYDILKYGDGFAFVLLDVSDEDGDSFPNWWEIVNGYDPLNPEAPIIEIVIWYAPAIIATGIGTALIIIILYISRHRIRLLLGRKLSDT